MLGLRADLALWLMAGIDELAELTDRQPAQASPVRETLPNGLTRQWITGGVDELKSILRSMKVG